MNHGRARIFDTRVAESIIAASKTCIPRNINNSEKARMSRNLGRQAHRAQQDTTHRKLDDDIVDTRSLLNTSTQAMKDLKTQLKELTNKKKEAGKAPRNNQAASNKFDVPIPKIRAGSATTNAEFELTPGSPTPNEDVEMQEIMPIDLPFEIGTPSNDSEEARYHPGFDLPSLDLDSFNFVLENELVPDPTAEEVAAYQFLKYSLER